MVTLDIAGSRELAGTGLVLRLFGAAELLRDVLRVLALLDQQGRERVPQVVEADRREAQLRSAGFR